MVEVAGKEGALGGLLLEVEHDIKKVLEMCNTP